MCGIYGAVGWHPSVPRISRPFDQAALRHRGPDSSGFAAYSMGSLAAVLGVNRLAIVGGDVPAPLRLERYGVTVAFNGEIYNWRALRLELSDGHPWETECDTEVVGRAWRRWGPGMLDRFNGMFAIALVDWRLSEVFLARDRAGEKPLFYAVDDGGLYFASEIKALPIPKVEVECPEVDVFEFDCLHSTPFKGVRRLGPGEYIHVQKPAPFPGCSQWWSLPDAIDESMTWAQAVDQTEAFLVDAIRLRAKADVPTTVLVSGGLDSAIIQAVVKAPRVYCATFPADWMDWMPQARLAAPGAEVVPVTFGLEDALSALPAVAYHLDTPATWTALSQWFLAKRMAADGIRVVLTGDGADELFAGYSRYRAVWWADQARRDPRLIGYEGIVELLTPGDDADLLARLIDRSPGGHARGHAEYLVRRFMEARMEGDLVADLCAIEWQTTMQCLLRMADRMTAAHSLENRSPFFDHRLIELAARMPTCHKITKGESKAVLRAVARRLGVHADIIDEGQKVGFVVPWNRWRKAQGERGAWDRADFAKAMTAAWRQAFHLSP